MIIIIECLVSIVLFTLIIVPSVMKNPLDHICDYPKPIMEKCYELGLAERREKRFSKKDIVRKFLVCIVFAFLFSLVLYKVNGVTTFLGGALSAYVIWLSVTWYDALIIDCIWFCHSKKVQIPGTENMKEYKDYWYHIRQSLIGTLLGIPVALLVGLIIFMF